MNKHKFIPKARVVSLHMLRYLAFVVATVAANTRCAYIYHNRDKPDELRQLKKLHYVRK